MEKIAIQELLDWYKAVNAPQLRERLLEALPEKANRLAYQYTAEKNSTRDIERLLKDEGIKVSFKTISVWQKTWVGLGLVRQVSAHKRERIFDLGAFDIDY